MLEFQALGGEWSLIVKHLRTIHTGGLADQPGQCAESVVDVEAATMGLELQESRKLRESFVFMIGNT